MATDHAIQAADLAGRRRQRTGAATATAPVQAEPLILDHRGHLIEEWEYDVITSEAPLTKTELNVLGRLGWIMTSYSGEIGPEDRSRVYYFRRRVQIQAKPPGVPQA
jgi:hypothetical protein